MGIYNAIKRVTSGSLLLLSISIVLAVIDNLFFAEAYRKLISLVGAFALCLFFVGITAAVIKGISEKSQ